MTAEEKREALRGNIRKYKYMHRRLTKLKRELGEWNLKDNTVDDLSQNVLIICLAMSSACDCIKTAAEEAGCWR